MGILFKTSSLSRALTFPESVFIDTYVYNTNVSKNIKHNYTQTFLLILLSGKLESNFMNETWLTDTQINIIVDFYSIAFS